MNTWLHNAKQEGIKHARLEDAQNMLNEGLDISLIAPITGLSEKVIRELDLNEHKLSTIYPLSHSSTHRQAQVSGALTSYYIGQRGNSP